MMDPREMNRLADEAAARAKRENVKPKVFGTRLAEPQHRELLAEAVRGIPFMGRYAPANWEIVPRDELAVPASMGGRLKWLSCDEDYVFVDMSGFGARDEPALTFGEFTDLVAANPLLGWAIAEVGQFQAVVGAYRHVDGPAPERVKRMTKDELARAFAAGKPGRCHNAMTDGREYTLHATVIARRNDDGSVTFNWGGWFTRTTKEHMACILEAMWRGRHALPTPGQAEAADAGEFTIQ